ncbi:MAG: phage tail tube protein [Pseudomonadota bacterium]
MYAGRNTEVRYYPDGYDAPFVKIGGARTEGLSGTAEPIDISSKQSGKARVLADDTGTLVYDISCEGVLEDDVLYKRFREQGEDKALHKIGFFSPNIGELQANFFINKFELGSGHGNAERTFSAGFMSSGNASFVEAT